MDSVLIYWVKSSGLAFFFLLIYRLFLSQETWFNANRLYLLGSLVLSFVLPLIHFTKTVWVSPPTINTDLPYQLLESLPQTSATEINWSTLLTWLYVTITLSLAFRLIFQLIRLYRLKKKSIVLREYDITHVQSSENLNPFSFFKNIFYNPNQFKASELKAVLTHELVHVRQYHSLDVLFVQLATIVFWFNPLIWLYQEIIKQNLEYLADADALVQLENKKEYQYLLLQQAVGHQNFGITNSFYQSLTRQNLLGKLLPNGLVKNRIQMLHQKPSTSVSRLKHLIILPVIAIFLLAFNQETEYKFKTSASTVYDSSDDFEFIITKSTAHAELESLKKLLLEKGVDLSYTVVRDPLNQIIDIQLEANNKNSDLPLFHSATYESNSEKEIEDILIKYSIGSGQLWIKPLANQKEHFMEMTKEVAPKSTAYSMNAQITNVTIAVDKYSNIENLNKDSEFLKSRGIEVKFSGIKKNAQGAITAIKVLYDNGSGDKGKFQQSKTDGITPFKVSVTFGDQGLHTIDILGDDHDKEVEVVNIIKSDGNKPIWYGTRGDNQKQLELLKEGNHTLIIMDGQEITLDSLEKSGKAEKLLYRIMSRVDTLHGNVKIENVKIKSDDGVEETIILDKNKSKENHRKYMIIKKDSMLSNKNNSVFIHIDEEEVKSDVFFLDKDKLVDKVGESLFINASNENTLVVIDGVQSNKESLTTLNPNAIASINIIKGNMAIKKYGEKAKDGVIEITLKK